MSNVYSDNGHLQTMVQNHQSTRYLRNNDTEEWKPEPKNLSFADRKKQIEANDQRRWRKSLGQPSPFLESLFEQKYPELTPYVFTEEEVSEWFNFNKDQKNGKEVKVWPTFLRIALNTYPQIPLPMMAVVGHALWQSELSQAIQQGHTLMAFLTQCLNQLPAAINQLKTSDKWKILYGQGAKQYRGSSFLRNLKLFQQGMKEDRNKQRSSVPAPRSSGQEYDDFGSGGDEDI